MSSRVWIGEGRSPPSESQAGLAPHTTALPVAFVTISAARLPGFHFLTWSLQTQRCSPGITYQALPSPASKDLTWPLGQQQWA